MRSSAALVAFCLVAALPSFGCSRGGAGKVTGSVTLNGKPLANAQVQFVPMEDTSLSVNGAETDAEGKFEIKPNPRTKETLRPGKYIVYIRKYVTKDGRVPTGEEAAMMEASGQLKNIVPRRYSDTDAPPAIRVEIKKGDNQLEPFKLTSR